MFLRSVSLLACVATLGACHRVPVLDPATLQTPAAEAALRYTIEHCPRRKEAKLAVLCLGDTPMSPATPAFEEKFKDLQGLEFIGFQRVKPDMVQGKPRRLDTQTRAPVLEIQISHLTEAKDGRSEAVTAWAFMDDAERRRLEIKEKPGGGFEIKELETIPITNRNDDRLRADGK